MGPQNTFRRIVMPELGAPESDHASNASWWAPMAHRLSAIEKYTVPQGVAIDYWQNVNDSHHYAEHFKPFVKAYRESGAEKLRVFEYEGPNAHVQPSGDIYVKGVTSAI